MSALFAVSVVANNCSTHENMKQKNAVDADAVRDQGQEDADEEARETNSRR